MYGQNVILTCMCCVVLNVDHWTVHKIWLDRCRQRP